jgi:hypothetical protein
MVGARHGTGPALNSDERRNKANWLRWSLVFLLIAATPFLWLLSRDAILMLHASDGEGEVVARGILVERFQQTIENSKIARETRTPMSLTMLLDPDCFVIDGAKLRISDTPPAQSSLRGGNLPSIDEILFQHRFLAERQTKKFAESKNISDSFSTSEISILNACMSATPFGGWCEERISARLDRGYDRALADVTSFFGTKLPLANEKNHYCYTMPTRIVE